MNKSTRTWHPMCKTVLTVALTAGLLSSMSGCALLVVGGAVGGAMSVSDRRTFGSQAEDTSIELKGASRIDTVFGDKVHVDVNSFNRKVLITGEVQDEATKAKVEAEIASLENVRSVVNEIQVALFLSTFKQRSEDTLLTTKVMGKLVGTKDIYSGSFKVVSEAGVVYLMGRVYQHEAEIAVGAIQEVNGVKKIVKVVEYIDPENAKNPAPIAAAVETKAN